MSVSPAMPQLTALTSQPAPARSNRRWLKLARGIWIALVLFMLLLFVSALPARLAQLRTVVPAPSLGSAQLTPGEAALLAQAGFSLNIYAVYLLVVEVLFAGAFIALGLAICWRRSDDGLALFVALTLIAFGIIIPPPLRTIDVPGSALELPIHFVQVLGWGCFFTFFYLFPDGRFVPRLTRLMPIFFTAWGVAWILFPPANVFNWQLFPAVLTLLIIFASGALAQIYRYRRVSTPAQRQQTKWVVFGMAGATFGIFLYAMPGLVTRSLDQPGEAHLLYNVIGIPFFALSILLIPITIDIAIRRNRLWQVDPLISRALVYVPLTAILTGITSITTDLSQKFFLAVTGEKSDAGIVLTTLLIVAIFDPIKSGLQNLVRRHLKEYPDPEQRLEALGDEIRKEMGVLHPRRVTQRFLEEAVHAYEARGGAVYLDATNRVAPLQSYGAWQEPPALTVPLESQGEVVGQLTLGPRALGREYEPADCARLQEVAQVIAEAIRESQPAERNLWHLDASAQ